MAMSSSALLQKAHETKITHILRRGTWQGRHHRLCRRKETTHFLRSIQGKSSFDIISVLGGSPCDEITHSLRRGHGKVVVVSCTGGTCHEITHKLRRGHDKVVIISIAAGEPMPQDHAQSKKGKWQVVIISIRAGSLCHKQDHTHSKKGTWPQSRRHQHCSRSSCDDITHRLRRGQGKVIIISIVAGRPRDEITHHLKKEHTKLSPSAL